MGGIITLEIESRVLFLIGPQIPRPVNGIELCASGHATEQLAILMEITFAAGRALQELHGLMEYRV